MELALELVNFLQPEDAERLMAPLLEAEACAWAAEERCRVAEQKLRIAQGLPELVEEMLEEEDEIADELPKRPSIRWVIRILAFLIGCAMSSTVVYLSRAFEPVAPEVSCNTHSVNVSTADAVEQLWDCYDNGWIQEEEKDAVCQVLLQEVQTEVDQMEWFNLEMQEGYNTAMEAVSEWVRFLHSVWSPRGLNDPEKTAHPLLGSELEFHCMQAAKEASKALDVLSHDANRMVGRSHLCKPSQFKKLEGETPGALRVSL